MFAYWQLSDCEMLAAMMEEVDFDRRLIVVIYELILRIVVYVNVRVRFYILKFSCWKRHLARFLDAAVSCRPTK